MTNSKTTGSESYIRIVCSDDADPKYNRLQLRSDPPTFIELQPGNNILSVVDYPDLEYGFKQIDNPRIDSASDATNEYNCGDVLLVDMSHFDSTDMTSMDMMFCRMENLENIVFGDTHIENVTSMKSAFEWIAAEELNLTSINFSEVVDAEMMVYCKGNLSVNLSGCDLSKVIAAEGIFNGVTELNLDGAVLSDAVIEAMRWDSEGGCEDLEEISMKGCDIRMGSSVIKTLNFLRTRIELDHKADGVILNYMSRSLPIPWTNINPRQWYFTIISGDMSGDNEIQRGILDYLKTNALIGKLKFIEFHNDIIKGIRYYPWERVYQCGEEFPIALIKTFFDFQLGIITANGSSGTYSFVVGNNHAAFSNNPKLKYYVPDAFRGFETVADALECLEELVQVNFANNRIIEIQYIDPSNIPNQLHSSKVCKLNDPVMQECYVAVVSSLIELPIIDWSMVYKSIEEAVAPIIEKCRKEMSEKTTTSEVENEEDDVFDPDFVPEED